MKSTLIDVKIHNLKIIKDARGNLIAGEFKKQIGFLPKRYFMVFGVPSIRVRGQHAHKKCHQFLVCIQGSLEIEVDDGRNKKKILLNKLNKGVHIPPMIWASHYNYKSDTILLVFASDHYRPSDYIRDRNEFLKLR
jgi:dTDP-4-dehydrorhamnose 3,5-epimerase-like enzyme